MAEEKKKTPKPKQSDIAERGQLKDLSAFQAWVTQLYDPKSYSDEEITEYYNMFRYLGFDRNMVLQELFLIAPDYKIASQIIVACALRGPQQAAQQKMTNGRSIVSMGIPASGGKGTNKITCQRITAATADLAAYFLKKINPPKRLAMDCPTWLQFPSAGSIKLPVHLREQHLAFAQEFSKVIGGTFNPQIYDQMIRNAYYDERLKLFD